MFIRFNMDIKNCKEIITEFVERYSFTNIYTDKSLPLGNKQSSLFLDNQNAISFLLASSLTGCKSIGFFSKLPSIHVTHSLRGECVFISRDIPDKIDIPTIFCRQPEDLTNILVLAIKVSSESKLPVSIVISDNVINNYTIGEKISCDLIRTSAYLHHNTFKTVITPSYIENCINTAENIISQQLKNDIKDTFISFNDSQLPFFSYLMPIAAPKEIDVVKTNYYTSYSDEAYKIENMINSSYGLSLTINSVENEEVKQETKDFLCAGCPIVNVLIKMKDSEKIIFTDIDCKGIQKAFNVNTTSFDSYLGLISDNLSTKTIFIGSASNYKQLHNKMLKNGQVIFLNDCDISNISICSTVKHPKKLNADKNQLFPYSCRNIKNYTKVKINAKKCNCITDNKEPLCIEKTKCPALYIKNDKITIDSNNCSGCLSCKTVCTYGAIK